MLQINKITLLSKVLVMFSIFMMVFLLGVGQADAKATPEQWYWTKTVYFELVEKSKGVSNVKLTKTKTGFDIKAKGLGKSNKEYVIVRISNQPEGLELRQVVNGKAVPVLYFPEDRIASNDQKADMVRDFYVKVFREGTLMVVKPQPTYKNTTSSSHTGNSDMAIYNLINTGVMLSVHDRDFKGSTPLTRGEAVDIIYRAMGYVPEGTSKFSDVKKGDKYYDAIRTITSMGYIDGYKDGTFRPNQVITRNEAVILAGRLAFKNGHKSPNKNTETYKRYETYYDWSNVGNEAKKYYLELDTGRDFWATVNHFEKMTRKDIQPNDKIDRVEGASILETGLSRTSFVVREKAWE